VRAGDVNEQPRSFAGHLLLALPGIGDPRFDRAVIALCAHDDGGALGVGIGHLLPSLRLHDVLKQIDIDPGVAPNVRVHHGGPVEPQRGFILHSLDWAGQESLPVSQNWGLTSTTAILTAIAEGKGPSRWLVALGYAGWSGGQLDAELTRHGWHLGGGDPDLVFATETKERWAAAYKAEGIDPALLVGVSGSA
jgi:putative transcriptional regulator